MFLSHQNQHIACELLNRAQFLWTGWKIIRKRPWKSERHSPWTRWLRSTKAHLWCLVAHLFVFFHNGYKMIIKSSLQTWTDLDICKGREK